MRSKEIVQITTNCSEFNRAYKFYLEHKGKIRCSRCKYNRGENDKGKWYGSYHRTNGHTKTIYPNWKLVSKNKKQWMKKPIIKIEKIFGNGKYKRIIIVF